MKVGDLVTTSAISDVWYKGLIGMLIGFDNFGHFSTTTGDPLVMYSQGTIRLAGAGLEVVE